MSIAIAELLGVWSFVSAFHVLDLRPRCGLPYRTFRQNLDRALRTNMRLVDARAIAPCFSILLDAMSILQQRRCNPDSFKPSNISPITLCSARNGPPVRSTLSKPRASVTTNPKGEG